MGKKDVSQHHYISGIAGVLVVIIIALQNSDMVTVRFLFWSLEMSRIFLILLVFGTGFLSGYVFQGLRKK